MDTHQTAKGCQTNQTSLATPKTSEAKTFWLNAGIREKKLEDGLQEAWNFLFPLWRQIVQSKVRRDSSDTLETSSSAFADCNRAF